MRTLAQTGNGWMTFKDAANRTCNQTRDAARRTGRAPVEPVHRDHRGLLRRRDRGVQPRLGQPRPAPDRPDGDVDWEKLRETVRTAVPLLDRVIDINFYPSDESAASNPRWRPVGLGLMGLQDVFFALRLPFDSAEAPRAVDPGPGGDLPDRARGLVRPRPASTARTRRTTRPAPRRGELQPDLWGVDRRRQTERWAALRADVAEHGLRNSLLIAIAPTATIASIAGCYECIEPQVSNLFKRETLSGEFLQVNTALVRELKAAACGRRRSARRSSAPRARCRASPSCPTTSGCCSAPRGSCRSGR